MIKKATKQLVPALSAGAGAIGQSYLAKLIPIENELAKNGITFVGGLVLAGTKNKLLQGVGIGMAAASVQKAAASFGIGNVEDPIAAIEDIDFPEEEEISGVEDPIAGNDDDSASEEEELD